MPVPLPINLFGFFRQIWSDQRGQDMIEYGLLAAALVIVVAGVLPPQILPAVSSIFSTLNHMMVNGS